MAIEDAAALGILFSRAYFKGDVGESLCMYEEIRLPRATKVQAAAARAASNINERIGTSKFCRDRRKTTLTFSQGFPAMSTTPSTG